MVAKGHGMCGLSFWVSIAFPRLSSAHRRRCRACPRRAGCQATAAPLVRQGDLHLSCPPRRPGGLRGRRPSAPSAPWGSSAPAEAPPPARAGTPAPPPASAHRHARCPPPPARPGRRALPPLESLSVLAALAAAPRSPPPPAPLAVGALPLSSPSPRPSRPPATPR